MPSDPYERRRAIIRIGPAEIRNMLDLPQGLHVAGVHASFDPMMIVIAVEGDQLDPVPDYAEAPPLDGAWKRSIIHDEGGNPHYRFGWSPDAKSTTGT